MGLSGRLYTYLFISHYPPAACQWSLCSCIGIEAPTETQSFPDLTLKQPVSLLGTTSFLLICFL